MLPHSIPTQALHTPAFHSSQCPTTLLDHSNSPSHDLTAPTHTSGFKNVSSSSVSMPPQTNNAFALLRSTWTAKHPAGSPGTTLTVHFSIGWISDITSAAASTSKLPATTTLHLLTSSSLQLSLITSMNLRSSPIAAADSTLSFTFKHCSPALNQLGT